MSSSLTPDARSHHQYWLFLGSIFASNSACRMSAVAIGCSVASAQALYLGWWPCEFMPLLLSASRGAAGRPAFPPVMRSRRSVLDAAVASGLLAAHSLGPTSVWPFFAPPRTGVASALGRRPAVQ